MPTTHELLKKFKEIKTLPHVAIRLSKLISDDSTPMAKFEETIRMDPTLVLRLLRMVNSPYYGLRQKVDSISRAVVYIGMKNLRNMLVVQALKEIFNSGEKEGVFSRRQLWLHCAAVSICGQMITERIFQQKGEDAFLCGILHDIGLILEDQVEQKLFLQTLETWQAENRPLIECEREIIGTDHCSLGYGLAKDWKFPLEVQETIKRHHDSRKEVEPSSLLGVIQISEFIVSKLKYSELTGMNPTLSSSLSDHIRGNVKEYKAMTQDLPEEMAKAEDLYNS
ncbi:MAG: HDOD domain-containing protein [Deltaproteobacteria bacterium]|nr:HDOD domain-containing protein [Deltaproteobacteria bacterium]MBW1994218.1 HDOD domain-containing protein [Deltaproteobacteria bacterium]MBW2152929.1 HDOD domain-containing protein [Deltaproteobacteria bacterium]